MAANLVELTRSALIGEMEEVHREVRLVTDSLSDKELWKKPLDLSNSIGHLILHLAGNLDHFVGAQLGGTGYVREREREFTETKVPSRDDLLANFDAAIATFHRVVGGLSAEQLAAPHPHAKFGNVLKALIHLVAHFALHRGQMSYIVRLVKK